MRDRVTLTMACTGCNPGFHLPVFTAMAGELFAAQDLDVELLDPPARNGLEAPARVAAGGSDFCLTSVTYFLLAQADAPAPFRARFGAVIYQRSALTAIVLDNGEITRAEDLSGRSMAWSPESDVWPGAEEYAAALADRRLDRPRPVRVVKEKAVTEVAHGRIDVLPRNANRVPALQAAGFPVTGIPLPADVYSTGLLVGDHVHPEVAFRARAALCDALEVQRAEPATGWRELSQEYPSADRAVTQAQWNALVPYIFSGVPVGTMEADKWAHTVSWLCRAHGIDRPNPETVYRADMATAGGPSRPDGEPVSEPAHLAPKRRASDG